MVKDEFEKEMEWFCDYYDHCSTPIKSKVWFELADKYPVEKFHAALIEHIRTDQQPFFPAFGKIYYHLTQNNGVTTAKLRPIENMTIPDLQDEFRTYFTSESETGFVWPSSSDPIQVWQELVKCLRSSEWSSLDEIEGECREICERYDIR